MDIDMHDLKLLEEQCNTSLKLLKNPERKRFKEISLTLKLIQFYKDERSELTKAYVQGYVNGKKSKNLHI